MGVTGVGAGTGAGALGIGAPEERIMLLTVENMPAPFMWKKPKIIFFF